MGAPPKRIIYFIGDGMGVAAVTAATYARGERLNMLTMPYAGLATTHEYEFVTTDSAASATALATGHKTHFEGVSVRPGTTPEQEADREHQLASIVSAAQQAGWRTGLVATSRITHATPAAFAANRHNRSDYEGIALDMSRSGIDVLLGAGSHFFESRSDGLNLLEQMGEQGYAIGRSADEVRAHAASASRIVGLMHERDMPRAASGERAMSLAEMTRVAIEALDRDEPEGFFLMVEGSLIDWEGHDMDGAGVVSETLDMDAAIGVALAYARQRDDTLVVVTADHETGGLSVLDPGYTARYMRVLGSEEQVTRRLALPTSPPDADVLPPHQHLGLGGGGAVVASPGEAAQNRYTFGPDEADDRRFTTTFGYLSQGSRPLWHGRGRFSASHTATMVPIFAEGPMADRVAEVIDNADLGARLIDLVRWQQRDEPPAGLEPKVEVVAGGERPTNVILLVGDGLGVSSMTAALYVNGSLGMLDLPVKGLVATHGTDRVVNDSAATATALATGRRTRSGAVGVAPTDGELVAVPSVLERAEGRGLRTGLVTTTGLTHATPAAFYAHGPDRRQERLFARQFIDLASRVPGADGIDVAFGGGEEHFGPEAIAELRAQGMIVETAWSDEPAAPGTRLMRLLAPQGVPSAGERREDPLMPTLAQMTRTAIASLAGAEKGFFLLVEGGQIDWMLHGLNRGQELIDEIVDFDEAVQVAVEFAREQGNTLVIVTSDHDHTTSIIDNHYAFVDGHCGLARQCGGSQEFPMLPVAVERVHRGEGLSDTALQGAYAPPMIGVQYAWVVLAANERIRLAGPHSANFVPLFATGPWAARLNGFLEQPEIGALLMEWAQSAP